MGDWIVDAAFCLQKAFYNLLLSSRRQVRPMGFCDTLILLDYDDTVFPTSWCATRRFDACVTKDDEFTENERARLLDLDEVLCSVILKMENLGTVILVSNATEEWILQTSMSHLKNFHKMLGSIVRVFSCPTVFGRGLPLEQWKVLGFRSILDEAQAAMAAVSEYTTPMNGFNLIVVGDDTLEMDAAHATRAPDDLLKTVQFMRRPSLSNVLEEWKLLGQVIEKVVKSDQNLSCNMSPE